MSFIKDSKEAANKVIKGSYNQPDYNTGTMFEKLFASFWDQMPIEQLEAQRMLLNKKIAEKKVKQRIIEAQKQLKVIPNKNDIK